MHSEYKEINLKIFSSTFYIDLVQTLSEKLFELLEFTHDHIYWMSIAIREAINNAIKHGNKFDPSKAIFIDFKIYPDKITICIKDEGEGFDIKKVPDPTKEENILKSSGRGIYYMKSFMDEVEFITTGKKGTILKLTKFRKSLNN